jgi:hypothetical protein
LKSAESAPAIRPHTFFRPHEAHPDSLARGYHGGSLSRVSARCSAASGLANSPQVQRRSTNVSWQSLTEERLQRHAFVAALLLTVAIASESRAQWLTGNDLERMCNTDAQNLADPQNLFAAMECLGYVSGVADAVDQENAPAGVPACFATKITRKQLMAVVKKYLADHPDQWQHPAFRLAAAAIVEAFPCPGK